MAVFQKFGKVSKAYAIRNELGKSHGYGYVCFEEQQSAAYVISRKKI